MPPDASMRCALTQPLAGDSSEAMTQILQPYLDQPGAT
jgi:hypothetical protein